ncbi:MAG: alpha/beta hydrolase family protein [Actinomycetota bacterium]
MVEEVTLSVICDGHRLNGGVATLPDPKGLALLLHGIPSVNPSEPGDTGYPGLARTFAGRGWAGAWVDMRGVRGSGGTFTIEGWVRDARAALDAARAIDGLSSLPTVIVGSSAGGAVAVEVARRGAPVDGLVLLAAPAAWLSFAGAPKEALHRITQEAGMAVAPEVLEDPQDWADEFLAVTAEKAMRDVGVPVLVVHGSADDVVPVDHARRIAEPSSNSEVRVLEGAGHQLRREPGAVDLVLDWLDRRFG